MQKRIELPDHNIFEEKSKQFLESKHAQRLQNKYESKPYEEKYQLIYYISKVGSWFCNSISALTASTWVFAYVFSLFKDLPYPFAIATFFTGIVLIGLEFLQRFLSATFFKDSLQYGFKSSLLGILAGMIIIAGVSVLFSYSGSFDFLHTVTSPPAYQAPQLLDVNEVKTRYQDLVRTADKTAQDYYNRRKYKGRIATEDAKKYQEYLDKGLAYRDSLNKAVALTEEKNKTTIQEAKEEYEEAIANYNLKANRQGFGLAAVSITAILLFYLCMWYQEYYDFKTASQYAILVTKGKPQHAPPTLPQNQQGQQVDYQSLFNHVQQLLQTQQKDRQEQIPLPSPPKKHDSQKQEKLNGSEPTNSSFQLPIGFFSENEREEQLKNLYIQHIQPFIQDFTQNGTQYLDKYTIAHRNFKTGKLEHLDFGTVTNRIGIYIGKIENSLSIQHQKALPNQMEKLLYWIGKREELLKKME